MLRLCRDRTRAERDLAEERVSWLDERVEVSRPTAVAGIDQPTFTIDRHTERVAVARVRHLDCFDRQAADLGRPDLQRFDVERRGREARLVVEGVETVRQPTGRMDAHASRWTELPAQVVA
jgi:hypothetical protein